MVDSFAYCFNPSPAEPRYTLPLQTVWIQISWLLKKPTDLDLHCLILNMLIYSNNPEQIIWLVENLKWAWHLNLFSMTWVNNCMRVGWVSLYDGADLNLSLQGWCLILSLCSGPLWFSEWFPWALAVSGRVVSIKTLALLGQWFLCCYFGLCDLSESESEFLLVAVCQVY